jgi:hypothetical protein
LKILAMAFAEAWADIALAKMALAPIKVTLAVEQYPSCQTRWTGCNQPRMIPTANMPNAAVKAAARKPVLATFTMASSPASHRTMNARTQLKFIPDMA